MSMKDITLLIAHPDDEALFAWPILDRVKRIVCASNDAFNPERTWCKERCWCLREVAELLGCEVVCHSNNSEFYRAPTRNGSLHLIASDLIRAVKLSLDVGPVLFSHNAWGEYGHLDHILCHHIARTVQAQTGCELLVTDIAVKTQPAWLPITPWRQGEEGVKWPEYQIDRPLYDRIKQIYDARGCWTWSFPVVEKCRVYSL